MSVRTRPSIGAGRVRGRFRLRPELLALEGRRLLSTFTVTSTADGGSAGTLRWAINQANTTSGANTIDFDPTVFGTPKVITLSGSKLELSNASGLQTIAGPAAGVTISGGENSRVFQVDNGATATLSGLTITGGSGGASGDGLYNNGAATLTDCTITGNSAGVAGGGLANNTGTMTIVACTIGGNFGNVGGGVSNNGGAVTISDSTISGNSAGIVNGGGLLNSSSSGTATLTDCTIVGNSTPDGGGVANYYNGTLTLTDCTVSGNAAAGNGGGLRNIGTATLTDCTVSGNAAGNTGGVANYRSVTFTDCTISGNSASNIGGVFNGNTAALTNTIVASNVAGGNASDIIGMVTGSNNLIGTGGSGGLVNGQDGNLVGVAAPLLAPLGDHGGPTQTVALLPGSPAIGAGTAISGLTTDQRGEPVGSSVDIGAFQSQGFTLTPVAGSTPQSTPAGTAFPNLLSVTVAANNPVEPASGGGCELRRHTGQRWRLGDPVGHERGHRPERRGRRRRHGRFDRRLVLRHGLGLGCRFTGHLRAHQRDRGDLQRPEQPEHHLRHLVRNPDWEALQRHAGPARRERPDHAR